MVRDRSTAVKPLSGSEVAAEDVDVLFLTWLAARSVEQLVDDALRPLGLTGDEFAVLSVLAARPEGLTPSELARWMAAPPTTVSSVAKRFESRGHVVRERDPDDGRSYRLRLTAAGAAAHRAAGERFRPLSGEVDERLGRRVGAVRTALLQVRGAADALRLGG